MNQPWRTLTPGVRVVVRKRLGPDEELLYSDVLGELLVVDDDGVLIETRRGRVHVPGQDIALAKVVPPAPERRPRRD
ncbi:MAG TPA: hypothetical protein VF413_06390 [Cellulomonas sp.]